MGKNRWERAFKALESGDVQNLLEVGVLTLTFVQPSELSAVCLGEGPWKNPVLVAATAPWPPNESLKFPHSPVGLPPLSHLIQRHSPQKQCGMLESGWGSWVAGSRKQGPWFYKVQV